MQHCFIDTETRALDPENADLRRVGAYRYTSTAAVTVITYAIDDGPVQIVEAGNHPLLWGDFPDDLRKFYDTAARGEGRFVAWNAAFDRLALRNIREPANMVDAMAVASACNLPLKLEGASRAADRDGKQQDGKKLIGLFTGYAAPLAVEHPEEWQRFLSYAARDVEELRGVWKTLRPLADFEWREYEVSEAINDRGLGFDTVLAERAARAAELLETEAGIAIREASSGKLYSVNQHVACAEYVHRALDGDEEAQSILERDYEEQDDGSTIPKLSLDRARGETLLALLDRRDEEVGLTDAEWQVYQIVEAKVWGAAATPKKFRKALGMVHDGRLRGQYVFNGAGQTGRFSSRGVQIHNLKRDPVPREEEIVERLSACTDDAKLLPLLREYGPPGRILSGLIRPAFIAGSGDTLVWGDWSNIEARVLPWLAKTPHGQRRLDVFRAADEDPDSPDSYTVTGAGIDRLDPQDVWDRYRDKDPAAKAVRQKGKIADLALGFGGGYGALQNMATAYRMFIPETEGRAIVAAWRETNPWATAFWARLAEAAANAIAHPGAAFEAGRVAYLYDPGYWRGTLFCALPSGHVLTYPEIKWTTVEREDHLGKPYTQRVLTYKRAYGRTQTWHGKLAENVTQAAAGAVLRGTLVRLHDDAEYVQVVGHTHDEVICETVDTPATVEYAKQELYDVMVRGFAWSEGLPLEAAVVSNWYYTKAIE